MKAYTNEDLRDKHACYDPIKHFKEYKGYTLLDYLGHKTCPLKDRVWCVTRFLDDRSSRLFAVWCARRALKLIEDPDPRSLKAIEIVEKFANSEASLEELGKAYEDAEDATCAANTTCAAIAAHAVYSASIIDSTNAAYLAATESASCSAAYVNDCAYFDVELERQIEKLEEEIKAGNWREK